ncbi:MAG: Ig-like domain-containing protein [Bacilli bacterium]|nr:Ig-like domain-containing protein [Bacilli bacterium]
MKRIQKSQKMKAQRKVKKGVLGLGIFLSCFLAAIVYVCAADVPTFTLKTDNTKLERGQEFTISVETSNMPDSTELADIITYDTDAFELSDYDDTTANLTKKDVTKLIVPSEEDGMVAFIMGVNDDALEAGKRINYNGILHTVTFTVKDSAKGGKYEFQLNSSLNNVDTEIDTKSQNLSVDVVIPVDQTSVSLAKDTFELNKGETAQINVNYAPADTTDSKEFTYSGYNDKIISVSSDGKITALSAGTTTITVNAFGKDYTANVTVTNHIKSVSLDESTLELAKGNSKTLVATINPSDTSDSKTITWTSSDKNVATVDENGKINAVGVGTANIKATTVNGMEAICKVTVIVPLTNATLSSSNLTVEKGESRKLSVTLEPKDTTVNDIQWTSSDESIAAVDENGNVTGISNGTAKITAKVGNFTLECNVTVVISLKDITLSDTDIKLLPTQKKKIDVVYNPTDTTDNKTITWDSNNKNIATVSSDGTITAVASGTTTITAKIGNITKNVNVKVLVPIDNVIIQPSSDITLDKGKSTTLSVSFYPDNAEEDKTVIWSSDKESVATVDKNGKVTAISGGKAVITGKIGSHVVTANITVEVPVNKVELNKKTLNLEKGSNEKLIATIDPTDATRKDIVWSSNANEVASVSSDGVVTAKKNGIAIITATVDGKSVDCTVNVSTSVQSVSLNKTTVTLENGKTTELVATVNPVDATYDKIEWTSSDKSIATVVDGVVTAKKNGKATITATVGGKSASATVQVITLIDKFEISKSSISIVKGKTYQLEITISPSDTTESKVVTWESANKNIATVDKNGVVTGVSKGTTKITGKLENGKTVTCDVEVTIIPVDSISFENRVVDALKGKKLTLKLNINPVDATEIEDISYTSDDEEIATVDKNGVVTPLKKGEVTITAKMGNYTATTKIVVDEIPLESIALISTSKNLNVGEKLKLNVVLNPEGATDEVTFSYQSSNEKIATVDENGNVTGVSAGQVTITVKASNGMESTITLNIIDKSNGKVSSPKTGVVPISIFGGIASVLIFGIAFVLKKKIDLK